MAEGIGPLTIKITASSEGVSVGLKAAAEAMNQGLAKIVGDATRLSGGLADIFTGDITKGIRGIAMGSSSLMTDLSKVAEKALGNPGRFIAEDIIGGLAIGISRIPLVGGILSLPFEGVASVARTALDMYDKGSERILSMSDAAMRANVSIADMQVITAAAGGDAEAASGMLDYLGRAIETARTAALGAETPFAKLGLDPMKLSKDREGLGQVLDAINATGDAALQAKLKRDTLGRGADGRLVARGSAGLDRFGGLLEGFGGLVSEGDVKAIRMAREASQEIALFKQSFETQVTIGLAPVLATIGQLVPKLSEMGITAQGVGETVSKLAMGLVDWAASMGDEIERFMDAPAEYLKEKWDELSTYLSAETVSLGNKMGEAIAGGIKKGIGLAGETLDYLDRKGKDVAPSLVPSSVSLIGNLATGLNALGNLFTGSEVKGAQELNEAMRERVEHDEFLRNNPGIEERAARLRELSLRDLNPMGEIAQGADLWMIWGADPQKYDRFKRMVDDAAKVVEDAMAKANAAAVKFNPLSSWAITMGELSAKLDSPAEKIKKEFADLQRRTAIPFGDAIDPARMQQALADAKKITGAEGFKMFQGLGGGGALGSNFVGAAEAGSREAYSAIAQYNAKTETIEEEIERRLEEANEIHEAHLEIGEKMAAILERMADEDWEP